MRKKPVGSVKRHVVRKNNKMLYTKICVINIRRVVRCQMVSVERCGNCEQTVC